ncbi:phosphotransferase family protein [Nocardia sp. alder85J]|uniref:phosphotransferase family protein n=1 Tax=Nocardia sp. alder85J TaxID=2862949 RepID=UPI001CD311DD|nr:phosphotransferase family protein [Nocardia sp. alder85J]MCX4095408.1 phosphotransferase family protein [Nocardia sp. alder85J]
MPSDDLRAGESLIRTGDSGFEIDQAVFGDWLGTLGLARTAPVQATRVGVGQSNLTFRITDAEGRQWILRRPPLGHLLASAHDVAREARVMAALGPTDVPVPHIHDVRHEGEVALVLMECVDGLVLDRPPVAEQLTPELRRATGVSLTATLARIHAVDLTATGLDDLASHSPYAARQLKRWPAQWEKSKTRELPVLDRLTERLRAAVPEQRELSLVHGDYNLRNVIVAPDSGQIAAVLDWELCTLGDPLADVGSLLAYWPLPGEPSVPGVDLCLLPGFPTREELIDEYLTITGRDRKALAFWHTLGLWKLAIIAEGVLRRALDNPRNRALSGTPTTELIDELIGLADRVATDAGL